MNPERPQPTEPRPELKERRRIETLLQEYDRLFVELRYEIDIDIEDAIDPKKKKDLEDFRDAIEKRLDELEANPEIASLVQKYIDLRLGLEEMNDQLSAEQDPIRQKELGVTIKGYRKAMETFLGSQRTL